jgi:uncharacterized protein RhaS with RHS repeats
MGSPIKRIRYQFDAVGNRKALIDHDGGRFTYSDDSVNRITRVLNPQGDRTTTATTRPGRRTVKKLANGTRASFTCDNAGRLTRLANLKSDGTTISSFGYKYDKVGNRTAVLEADGSRDLELRRHLPAHRGASDGEGKTRRTMRSRGRSSNGT